MRKRHLFFVFILLGWAVSAQSQTSTNSQSCESLFQNGKKIHENAGSNLSALQEALKIFEKGYAEGCNPVDFGYWMNICKAQITYYNATLTVAPSSTLMFEPSVNSQEVKVTTNMAEWEWSNPSALITPWFSLKKDNTTLTVTCEENKSLRERRGSFSILAGCKTKKIEIIQNGKKNLLPEVIALLSENLNSNPTNPANQDFKYKGEKLNDKMRNGLGAQLYNGDLYFGMFSNGAFTNGIYIDGEIQLSSKTQVNKYQVGNFANAQLSGEAKTYNDDGVLTYNGKFYDDAPSGGSYWTENLHPDLRFEITKDNHGGYYMGETKDGIPHGKGIYINKNKDIWYGDWLNGAKSHGIEINFNGTIK